jgi:hypothetical protein
VTHREQNEYGVFYDITDVLNEIDTTSDIRLYNAVITQSINSIHEFNFTINILHPMYEKLIEKKSRINVTFKRYESDEKVTIFTGYISRIKELMDSSGKFFKNVVCESVLGYLYDSIQTYWTIQSETFTFTNFITQWLSVHNSQVEDFKRIYVGDIENDKPTYNSFTISYGKSYDVLKYILNRFGGEYQIRLGADGKQYFDYTTGEIINSPYLPDIKLAYNLQSLDSFIDGTKVVTRLYPFGAKIKDSDGNDTETRVDISSVNGGRLYITADDNGASLARYGNISDVEIFNDVTNPAVLMAYGQASVNDKSTVTTSYKISALDLSTIGLDLEEFQLGGKCKLINPVMQIDREIRIIKLTIDINAPQKSSIEVGEITQSVSSLTAQSANLSTTVAGIEQRLPEMQQQTLAQANQNTKQAIDALGEVITKDEITQLLLQYVTLSYLQGNYSTTMSINSILSAYTKNADQIDGSRVTGTLSNILLEPYGGGTAFDLATKIADLESRITALE